MKNKILCSLVALLAIGMLAGCGRSEEDKTQEAGDTVNTEVKDTEETDATEGSYAVALKDVKVEEYVTLGEYKGLQVNVAPAKVDEAELEALMDSVYFGNVTAENGGVTNRAVAMGDTVNIDYEGKKDGVAFAGGTAQGSNLTIGSGQFIAGFEDGLVGVMPGETVDLDLTFPEAYHSAELAGQAVVFTVTVNFIMPQTRDDAVIAGMGIENVTNEEELRQYVYDYLYQNALYSYETTLQNTVMDAFMKNCSFVQSVPESLVNKYKEASRTNITATAGAYGMDADTFTNMYYQMDMETFVDTYAEETVKQDVALQAVANAEGLNVSDEELDSTLLEKATQAGYDTIEEYIGETSKEDYREYFMYEKVLQFLVDNAAVAE